MKKSPFSSSPLKHWDIELEPEFFPIPASSLGKCAYFGDEEREESPKKKA